MSESSRAVFLSYASQDASAVARVAEALRASGVEVWFDKDELVGGDAWDAKIRGQIASCALFVPVISAATQARLEGYFRIEWKLAARRTHAMATAKAFLLPVVIDATRDAEAHVPDEFRDVQWTRLAGGESAAVEKFCARVGKLLEGEGESAVADSHVGARLDRAQEDGRGRVTPLRRPARVWVWPVALGLIGVVGLAWWRPWLPKPAAGESAAVATAPTGAGVATELARLRAQVVPDKWQRADFDVISAALDRLEQTAPENAEIWSLRSIIHSLQALRAFDRGTKPLEVGRSAANRALRISPTAPSAHLALGLHHLANMSRGGDPRACRDPLDRALAAMAPDALTRWAELASYWLAYDFETAEQRAQVWLKVEPQASYPAWVMEISAMMARRLPDMQRWGEIAAAGGDITGVRALTTLADGTYFMRADPVECRAILDRVPAAGRALHRVVFSAWLFAMADRRWDEALQELAQVPEVFFTDGTYSGPKSLLAALAHQRAGRPEAAVVQFREAERLLREQLATDAEHESHRIVLALVLAHLGRSAEARAEIGLVEPLIRRRAPNNYWAYNVLSLTWAHAALGDHEEVAYWLRKIFSSKIVYPLTPAMVRIDPRFYPSTEAPVIQALLHEFAALDQHTTAPVAGAAKSVAVLAFANLSDDKGNEIFSDGISEELINVLGRVSGLTVKGRASSFYFKGSTATAQEKGQRLGATYLVDGSVRRQGNAVRITAQVSRAATDEVVWTSEPLVRELKDMWAVQEEIAGLIAKALSLKLGAASVGAKAEVNPEVYRLYLEGRAAWRQRTAEGETKAEELFRQALVLDPNFARGHAGLADVWVARAQRENSAGQLKNRNDAVMDQAMASARRALQLDASLAEAHGALGSILWMDWKVDEAIREHRVAVALNPSDATAHQRLGRALLTDGRIDEALAALRRAHELDPLFARIADNYSMALIAARRFDEAVAMADRAIALQPELRQALAFKSVALADLGRNEEALAVARRYTERAGPVEQDGTPSFVAYALARVKASAESERLLGWVREDKRQAVTAAAWLALGKRDEASAVLQAGNSNVGLADVLFWWPVFDAVRDEPEFKAMIAAMGLTDAHARAQAWRKEHPPEKPGAKQ